MKKRLLLIFVFFSFGVSALHAKDHPVMNELSLEFPMDGGLMVMGSRMWSLSHHVSAGVVAGGGQINRSFTLSQTGGPDYDAETRSLILPYIGPRLTAWYSFVGISVGYGVFWSQTDLTARRSGQETLKGRTTGWGTGVYSPFLEIDFYNSRLNMIFGFGLGGFIGTSFPQLKASSATRSLVTDASPLDTLTFHVNMGWSGNAQPKRQTDDF